MKVKSNVKAGRFPIYDFGVGGYELRFSEGGRNLGGGGALGIAD